MRIAQIAPVQGAIPPNTYGGTERVVSILTEALVELGHDVTLYASGDSQTRARLVPTVDEALLLPIDWPEPFDMVFIEAMACGTPVLTCPHGAAPELLQEGVTGFLRTTVHDLAGAVSELLHLSRSACRAEAERRFDVHRMAHDYVQVYSKVQAWARGRQIWSVPSM